MSSADLAVRPVSAAPAVYRGTLWRQVRAELRLVFRRRRNIAMLVVLAAIPTIIGIALKLSNHGGNGAGPAFFGLVTSNGLFLAFASLTACLPVFLPLAVAIVGGDAIAGEASAGTLRYLLTVPVSRTRLLMVKSIGTLAYVAGAVALVALTGLVVGGVLFGLHEVTLLSGDTVPWWDGIVRSLFVVVFCFIDLVGLAAMALFFSTLTEVPIGAMAGTIASVIGFAVVNAVPELSTIHPVLLTDHWLDFAELLRGQVHVGSLVQSTTLPLVYTAIFGSLAWARITSADVTS